MNAVHDFADRLLDLAYGELPSPEAKELEAHVRSCNQCANALDDIKGVRRVMGQLPASKEPDTGLESLLAYAEQSARRASAGPAPASRGWRRWLAPVLGATAVAALGAVTFTTMLSHDAVPSPSQVLAEEKFAAAPVAMTLPVDPPMLDIERREDEARPDSERRADEAKSLGKTSEQTVVLAQKPAPEPMRKAAPVVVSNSADLRQGALGNSNMGPLNDGLDRGGGGALGGRSGDSAVAGAGSGVGGLGTRNEVSGGEGKGGYVSTKDAYKERNDPLIAAKSPREQQQPPPEEFDFKQAPSADKAADTDSAYNNRGFASRAEVAPKKSAEKSKAKEEVAESEYAAVVPASPPPPIVYRDRDDQPMGGAKADSVDAVATATSADEAADDDMVQERSKKQRAAAKTVAVDPNLNTLRLLVQQAREFRAAGNRAAEAKYLRQAVSLPVRHVEHAGALIMLGDAETALGNSSAAAAAWQQAISLYPSSGTSQMANIHLQKQKGLSDAPGQKGPADMKRAAPRNMEMQDEKPAVMQ